MGVSVFTDYLIANFKIDRSKLSLAYMIGTFSSALFLPFAGRILDRRGARFLGVFSAIGLSLFLIALSLTPYLLDWLSAFSSIKILSFLIVTLCFLGIRHFGQGQMTMAARTMMGLWFEKRRGLMLGLSGVFVAFGFGASPLFITSLITTFTWVQTLQILGIMSLVMAIVAYIFYRRSPEYCGLVIDGGVKDENIAEVSLENSFTVKEAKSTFTFWSYNLGLTNQAMLITAITFHLADIGRHLGVSSEYAFSVFLPVSFISVFADLLGGYLSDKIPVKYLLAAQQLGLVVGILGLQIFNTALGFSLFAVGFGVSGGLFALLNGAAWPKLFGRQYLGAIVGVTTSWLVGGSAVGPYLYSLGKTFFGSYEVIIYCSLAFPIAVLIMSFFVVNPRKERF